MNKRLLSLLLVALTAMIAVCTAAGIGKASSDGVPYLTQKAIGQYDSYKHVEGPGSNYYIVGGHKYNSDSVRKITQASNNSNYQVNVVVKEPVMKANLSAHQKKQMKDTLVNWKEGNEYLEKGKAPSFPFKSSPDYSKWSLHRLFKEYQKANISVVITEN